MPLSLRPYSGNTFALSKVWFCTSTVNLRETDFASINSFLKKWIYANLILKPEELLLFRPVKSGGLGLVSIKQKSTAFLIRTFMEVAANPEYQTSQYLNSLYQFYILEEDFSRPSLPPYYSASFFNTIHEAKNEGNDIVRMSTRQWYLYLMDREIFKKTMSDGSQENNLCRIERNSPDFDWTLTWKKIRLPLYQVMLYLSCGN